MTALLVLAALLQQTPKPPTAEEIELEAAVRDAGGSSIEYARALERHLKKYPNSERHTEIERILAQAAVDLRDKTRILRYGVPVIENGSRNPLILDHVTRTLLDKDDKESNERALKYARLLTAAVDEQRKGLQLSKKPGVGKRLDDVEFALARSYTFQSRALGNLGKFDEAAGAASEAWTIYPSAEAARERSKWLEKAGKPADALSAFCDAMAIRDEKSLDADDAVKDRERLATLAKAANGSESAFGPSMLASLARVAELLPAREKRLKTLDANFGVQKPSEFTLSGLTGPKLALASLKGKVVVIDFWATWCGPCRAQHPLYEQVKKKFKDSTEVVFLAVSTDEDRDLVEPFLDENKWSKEVYFEDGLGVLLRVNNIPTTLILDRTGAISGRLVGFNADRFVDVLTTRIQETLQEN